MDRSEFKDKENALSTLIVVREDKDAKLPVFATVELERFNVFKFKSCGSQTETSLTDLSNFKLKISSVKRLPTYSISDPFQHVRFSRFKREQPSIPFKLP